MNLDDLRRLRDKAKRELEQRTEQGRWRVVVCLGTSGLAQGAREVMQAFVDEVERRELTDVVIAATGSSGVEDLEPIATVEEQGADPVVYGQLTPAAARQIINEHIIGGKKVAAYVIARQLPREVG